MNKMRLGLLSDTHILNGRKLPAGLVDAFHGVDLILHAGDIYAVSVLDELQRVAPVIAASGDDDDGDTLLDKRVHASHILSLEGLKLLLVHERPARLRPPWRGVTGARSEDTTSFSKQKTASSNNREHPDIIVFGHEHQTIVQRCDEILLVSPGSPTLLNYRPGPGTIGMLEIESGEAQVRILRL